MRLRRGLRAAWALAFALAAATISTAAHAAPAAGSLIANRAEAVYVPAGQVLPETLYSNTVKVRVEAVESLALTADTVVNRPAGAPVALPHLLANTGNVVSALRFELQNQPGDDHDLGGLRLVRDLDGNGRFDPGEPVLPAAGEASGLSLAPGEAVALIVLGHVPAAAGAAAPGRAVVRLLARTGSAAPASASVTDTVRSGRLAAVTLDKRADQAGDVAPGTLVRYHVVASNVGDRPATPSAVAGPSATPILIDGAPATVLLLRDPIPAGAAFVPGSLVTSLPGAQRLYRLAGDAPFSYRSNGDDIAAVEVAVASRGAALAPNATTDMGLAVRVLAAGAGTAIVNRAQVAYDDGAGPAETLSNLVTLRVPQQRVGLAKRAAAAVYEHDPVSGRLLGTALVRLAFVVENFGPEPARQVQVRDLLAGAQAFGRYTANRRPDAGQYTVLADSVRVKSLKGGATLAFDAGYTGDDARATLLAPGTTLPPYGAAELSVDVRVNASGRDGVVRNSAQLSAALGEPAHTTLHDEAVDGSVPDANGDGDPSNDASPTPILLSLPSIAVEKTAGAMRRLDGAVRAYEVDYRITVTNTGKSTAAHVQLADNLSCTFRADLDPSPVTNWSLVAPPRATRGLLAISAGYTGRGACRARLLRTGDPYAAPANDPAILLTDGARHLDPGQSEQIAYTVRFELDPKAPAGERTFDNLVVASIRDRPDGATSATVVSSQSAAEVVPLDPSGIVYHAGTREPVAGASVRFWRAGCQAGASGPITEAELVPVPDLPYRLGADGSVSQTTDAQGRYAFVLRHPPVVDSCEYRIAAIPPEGSGLRFPSSTLPPQTGVAPGGPVQAQPAPPAGAQPTTHYLRFRLGPGLPDVWHNHVPLDAVEAREGLVAQKGASRAVIEIGQTVDYLVRVRNVGSAAVWGLAVSDWLPAGLRYVAGSTRLDGRPAADPQVAAGAPLRFDWPALRLDPGREVLLAYRVLAGVGTKLGDAVNRAQAFSGQAASNEASHTLRVDGGVFSEEGFVVGKVFLDCSRDGVQRGPEVGIPGVRLLLEDGSGVVTDIEGKYSFYGLRAITHVLKLDTTTLPPGARVALRDTRQAGRPDSRFVDLKKGELHQADFAVEACDAAEVVAEVRRRRELIVQRPEAEGEAVSKTRLEVQPAAEPSLTEVRRRAASGEIGPTGPKPSAQGGSGGTSAAPAAPAVFEPLRTATEPVPARPGDALPPRAPLAVVDLERLLEGADASAGFVDLKDGDTLPMALAHVRVKGRIGATLRLVVNGRVESDLRVGKRVRIAERELEAWEYIGVQLQAGPNRLQLDELDGFGNVRGTRAIAVVAPGRAGRLEVELPATAVADAATPVRLRVRLTDDQGVPVTARTQLTLELDRGRFDVADLNSAEPGTQVFIDGGAAEFAIVPPNEPKDGTLRVSSGTLVQERRIAWLPELRPLVGAGIVEGTIDLRRRGPVVMGVDRRDAFEQTLRHLSTADGGAAARVAFYFKGTLRGDLLLTAAYDSDKDTRERLFRDIQPDRYYPIYGDSAARIFDAQSSGRLFVRIDRERSYLLYGDFTTDADEGPGGDPRRLGLANRAATGVKARHETSNVKVEAFASHDSVVQQIVEFPADGTSGPYRVPVAGEWRENSERVEILVRDRDQPAVIRRTIPMQRFADYVVDPVARRLLFTQPVSSLDPDLNTRHIRVSVEVAAGGESFWMGGGHARVQVLEGLQVGASVVSDRNPVAPATLVGATAVVRPAIDPASTVVAEWARSDTVVAGSGDGGRLEWTRDAEGLAVRAQVTATDSRFTNPASGFGPGRTEASATARAVLAPGRELFVEALASRDDSAHVERQGATAMLAQRIGDQVVYERTSAFGGVAGNRSDALTGAAEYSLEDRLRAYGSLEWRLADAGDARLNALGIAWKLDRDWSLLARSTVSLQDGRAERSSTMLARQQIGLAWRQVDTDRWNALGRYEHALKDVDGGLLPEREQAHIVSMHVAWQPQRGLVMSGRQALKVGTHTLTGISTDFWASLLYGRVLWDVTEQWDASVQAAVHWGQQGTVRPALGVESGYRVADNLWLSLGYNLVGLRDELLAGGDTLDHGPYLRMRYKFDEGLFR